MTRLERSDFGGVVCSTLFMVVSQERESIHVAILAVHRDEDPSFFEGFHCLGLSIEFPAYYPSTLSCLVFVVSVRTSGDLAKTTKPVLGKDGMGCQFGVATCVVRN